MDKTSADVRNRRSIAHALLGASVFTVLFAAALTARALPYGGVVFFGDSLADTGNNAILVDRGDFAAAGFDPSERTTLPIAGDDFVPVAPYASNRYSNGPVWTDQFAAALGFAAVPALAGGNNFAFGGATSGPTAGVLVPSLREQVDTYLAATGGIARADVLYVIEGGGNDVRRASSPAAALVYADNIAYMVSTLVAAGARNILLATVPDVGLVPSVMARGAGIAAAATALAAGMNTAAAATLAGLTLPAGTDIDILDLFGLLDAIVSNPGQFGFADGTHACAADPVCIQDPSGSLFWDGLHPTSAGARMISRTALLALEVPEPASVLLVLSLLLAFATRAGKPAHGARSAGSDEAQTR